MQFLSEIKINENETLLDHLINTCLNPPTPIEVVTTPSSNFGLAILDVILQLKNDPEKYQQITDESIKSLKQEEVELLFDVMQHTPDEFIETIHPYLRNERPIEINEKMTPESIKDALKSKDLDITLDALTEAEKQIVLTSLYPDSMSDPEKKRNSLTYNTRNTTK